MGERIGANKQQMTGLKPPTQKRKICPKGFNEHYRIEGKPYDIYLDINQHHTCTCPSFVYESGLQECALDDIVIQGTCKHIRQFLAYHICGYTTPDMSEIVCPECGAV